MEFRTRYSRIRCHTDAGSPYLNTYKNSVDKDGHIILIKTDRPDNIQNKIEAERSSCDLKAILARLTKDELTKYDISRGGLFGDFTKVPKSISEFHQRFVDAENFFKTLPVEVRDAFDQSSSVFFSSIGTEYYDNIMKNYFPENYDNEKIIDFEPIKKEGEIVE